MKRKCTSRSTAGVCAVLGTALAGGALVGSASAQDVLPATPAPFKGQIGLSVKDSKSDFPKPVQAPKGAPNVVLIILDDVGYGASSTFGGAISTPTLDRLAQNGLRYTQFHTTSISSPTRAALLTGRNHHTVHTANIMELATVGQEDSATVGLLSLPAAPAVSRSTSTSSSATVRPKPTPSRPQPQPAPT